MGRKLAERTRENHIACGQIRDYLHYYLLEFVLQEIGAISSGCIDFVIGDGGVMSPQTLPQDRTAACDGAVWRSDHWIMVLY